MHSMIQSHYYSRLARRLRAQLQGCSYLFQLNFDDKGLAMTKRERMTKLLHSQSMQIFGNFDHLNIEGEKLLRFFSRGKVQLKNQDYRRKEKFSWRNHNR